MDFDREKFKSELAKLAADGVYIGTSSWKYSGWCDQIYDREKYITRGKFAEYRLERKGAGVFSNLISKLR